VLVTVASCSGNVADGSGGSTSTTPGSPAPAGGGACDVGSGTAHVCTAYTAAQDPTHAAEAQCAVGGGNWIAVCAPGGLGTCTFAAYTNHYYPGANATAAQAQSACMAAGGTWQ
jgi:hypothetical protein